MAPKKISDAVKAAGGSTTHRVARRGDISNNVIAPFRSQLALPACPSTACRVARRRAACARFGARASRGGTYIFILELAILRGIRLFN